MNRSVTLTVAVLASIVTGCTGVTPGGVSLNGNAAQVATTLANAWLKKMPPPAIVSQLLQPVFPTKKPGEAVTVEDVRKLLSLTNGQRAGSLPKASSNQPLGVTIRSGGSAFQILGGRRVLQAGTTHRVGTGAASPFNEAKAELADLQDDNDAPIFEAKPQARGKYSVMAGKDKVDLRAAMPAVRDQGQRGTCVLFAAAGILDHMYRNEAGMPIKQASPQFMNWLYHISVKSKIDAKTTLWTDDGTYPTLFYPLLHVDGNREVSDWAPYVPPQQGYLSESEVPYEIGLASSSPDADKTQVAKAHLGGLADRIAKKEKFQSQGAYFFRIKQDIASYEAALADNHPIQLTYPIYGSDWDDPAASPNFAIPEFTPAKASSNNVNYHSVAIVGYERDMKAPGGGWFIVRNSWSDGWGDRGHCRISYDTTMNYATTAHIATSYAKPFSATYDLLPPPQEAPPLPAPKPTPTTNTNMPQPTPTTETVEADDWFTEEEYKQWLDEGYFTDTAWEQAEDLDEEKAPPITVDEETGMFEEVGHEGDEYAYDDYFEWIGYDYDYEGDQDDSTNWGDDGEQNTFKPVEDEPTTDDDEPTGNEPTDDDTQSMVNANVVGTRGDRDGDGIPDMVDSEPDVPNRP